MTLGRVSERVGVMGGAAVGVCVGSCTDVSI